ncbi:hypothetical protein DPMN_045574 [Dreissena polymorpha]|uniref:Uncharacterized protein n=1 Tax=Dreissena polymorpha TaxID=45954 RepID=A0A9D4D4E3_DREPO|nr:hypothetical protein DPMN_045574 [Dreissena polymorpha]
MEFHGVAWNSKALHGIPRRSMEFHGIPYDSAADLQTGSYVLHKEWSTRETKKRRYTHLDFRRELLKELIGGYRKRKNSDRDDAVDRPAVMPVENIVGHRNVRLNAKRTTCKYHKTRVGHPVTLYMGAKSAMYTCVRSATWPIIRQCKYMCICVAVLICL